MLHSLEYLTLFRTLPVLRWLLYMQGGCWTSRAHNLYLWMLTARGEIITGSSFVVDRGICIPLDGASIRSIVTINALVKKVLRHRFVKNSSSLEKPSGVSLRSKTTIRHLLNFSIIWVFIILSDIVGCVHYSTCLRFRATSLMLRILYFNLSLRVCLADCAFKEASHRLLLPWWIEPSSLSFLLVVILQNVNIDHGGLDIWPLLTIL